MKSVDTDCNGTIDYNEFLSATIDKEKLTSKNNLELAFKSFDRDGSGKINMNEIKAIFNNSTVKDDGVFQKIIKEADGNNDGEISLDEFKSIMLNFFV
jgi:calcium-dependent protein kinase